MGAYLSEPVTEKLSSDEDGEWLSYGASSMQGWRVSQEDAHNSILDFDGDTHIFAVYDGHGGHEVSAFTSLKLPEYLKSTQAYKDGNLSYALTQTFLGLDKTLVCPDVVAELKIIAGTKDEEDGDDDSDSDSEDVQGLYDEATMPLDQVMAARYPHLAHHTKEKVTSPFLKAKGNISGSSNSDGRELNEPIKFNFKADDSNKDAPAQASSGSADDEQGEGAEVNGEEPKHMVNGEESVNKDEKEVKKDEENGVVKTKEENGKLEDSHNEETKTEELKENGDTVINGEEEQQETGKGKGKASGKGGKGKALLKNSEIQALKEAKAKIQAMREAKAKGKRREAAIRAAEMYRQIQKGGGKGANEAEASDDDEDEEDDNFEEDKEVEGEEEEGEEDADGEESEDDDDDDDDDDEEEDEAEVEEDDPYTEFAMNMKEEPGYDSGCTACVGVVKNGRVTVANVGDSRCVVSRAGRALDLSIDHKPEDDPEAARIIRAGGRVTADGRVNGGLNLSRAIGDHGYKQKKDLGPEEQMISPLPEVRSLALTPDDTFMIVACDGIWNSLTSQEACDFVAERLEEKKLSTICEELFDHCLAPDTHGDGTGCDNMTCIIVKFNPSALEERDADQEEGVVVENVTIERKEEEGEGSTEVAGGVKRRSDEAEIDSPKPDEKKLKSSE